LRPVLTVDALNSLLAAVALWFFSFFIGFASDLVAEALAPVKNPRDPEEIVANREGLPSVLRRKFVRPDPFRLWMALF
jgi:hypothetical protein